MTDSATAKTYLRTKVLTATPQELRLMLIDGAIRFARMGREGLQKRDFEQAFNGVSQCRAIVLELMTSVRREHNPELCDRVQSVYMFLFNELINASMEKDPSRMDRVIELLEFERETWVLLMEKLREEAAGRSPPPAPQTGQPSESPSSLSLQA